MKKLLFLLAVLVTVFSCSEMYDDSALTSRVDGLEDRITALEQLCRNMNSDIAALQTIVTALQSNDYVTGISKVLQNNVEIGYEITFSKSGKVTIYHGQDGEDGAPGKDGVNGENGKDGADGADGHTPVIGVRLDKDGVYYWTVDGEWLLDENGNKVVAVGSAGDKGDQGDKGDKGDQGDKGDKGNSGADGVTPILKIENGLWYVSYENGADGTWIELGEATGADGAPGSSSSSIFSSVDTTDPNCVIFTIAATGETIRIPTWAAHEALYTLCNEINTNISSLQAAVAALESNDYVTSVTPLMDNGIEIGYIISFSKSGAITIYHGHAGENGSDGNNGTDGSAGSDAVIPVIGVRMADDGLYYWTLDGEWLTDEYGSMVRASGTDGAPGAPGEPGTPGDPGAPGNPGVTPQLKIEDGYWWVSYENGADGSWQQLGPSTGESGSGSSITVTQDDHYVTIILGDGTSFSLPRFINIEVTLDIYDQETGVQPGKEIIVNYSLSNATDATVVTASSDGNYVVRIEKTDNSSGRIIVKCPEVYTDGFINFIVSDGKGYSKVNVINFYEQKVSFSDDYQYNVDAEGGNISIPFSVNFDYHVVIDDAAAGWISIAPEVRSYMTDSYIDLTVTANDSETVRSGKVYIYADNNNGDYHTELTINQSSAYLTLERTRYVVPVEGGEYVTGIISSRGLSVVVPEEDASWISAVVTVGEATSSFVLTTTLAANDTDEMRASELSLFSSDGSTFLGSIGFVQLTDGAEDPEAMIFTTRANFSNDFTAYLPLYGEVDCFIDWGDGNVEYINGDNDVISHVYDVSEPASFDVKVIGQVERLSSYNITTHTITDVKQWGNVGLRNMGNAFSGNIYLTSVSDDLNSAFADVKFFYDAFNGCTGLTTLPENLFAACTNVTDFGGTFSGCTGLTTLPENLFAACANVTDFGGTFSGCTGLTTLPENLFAACANVTDFGYTFSGCTGLTTLPEKLFAACTNVTDFGGTFKGCTGLTALPEKLFAECTNVTNFVSAFTDCTGLTTLPEKLFANCTEVVSFERTFDNCVSLVEVPAALFDNNRKIKTFYYTFDDCNLLSGESPYTLIGDVKVHLYERADYPDYFATPTSHYSCFSSRNLTDYDQIPDDWK